MKLLSRSILTRLGWSTAGYGVVQALRLVNNVVLARLLAPELFGIMIIVNTVRTGIELASDIGIGQNIISNPRAEQPDFYDTAWTLQLVRGLALGMVCAALAWPVAWFYRKPELAGIFAVASLFFVFAGFESTGRFIAQKHLRLAALTAFEVGYTAISTLAHILFALATPTIWALVFGGITSSAAVMVASYLLIPGMRHRFLIDRGAMREILSFGRWVALSSIVYFLAMNFDRLYMARAVSLAVLGTYGIARSLADILNLLVARFGNMIVFPMVAASFDTTAELRARLARHRPLLLLGAAAAVAGFIAISDLLTALLYDQRYQAAGQMLPALSFGVWFAILSTINESVLLGIGKPVYGASANIGKFAWLLVGLPLAVNFYGISGAVLVIASAELVRYVPLWVAQRREGLSFARQDLAMTLVMLGLAVLFREALYGVGLTGDVTSLLPWK
ncbi:oligosaccharide flippase family protein [Sphingomonas phyllosphaerae]|uniref:oligosaccharide flippase family protein n=1 Tax=Sphingomonas phyllosphaerae TaxID=257003 RepID=UPI00241342A3|nr:oligosaccharide flippase family protein [Sphingomonas phyllosphaerae]